MGIILGGIGILVLLGISRRLSNAIGISWIYSIICLICWGIGAILCIAAGGDFFTGGEEDPFKGFEMLLSILIVVFFPMVLILVIKTIGKFIKWAISGIT
ncbi:MAG: hypothetical protein LBD48_06445 [Treponema sp.]|jgi:hypothetical protein|nr:hypothetical protein [Treponema sp.]